MSDSEGHSSGRGGRRRAEGMGSGSGKAWAGVSAPPPAACVPCSEGLGISCLDFCTFKMGTRRIPASEFFRLWMGSTLSRLFHA